MSVPETSELRRHFGLLQATALNVTLIVGAGVFVTVPMLVTHLTGPWALLGWGAAAVLMFADALVWGELAASLPGSGGSYRYLLEGYGREKWGRAVAFLFVWQFLISGPLEVASGLVALGRFSNDLSPAFRDLNRAWTVAFPLLPGNPPVALTTGPGQWLGLAAVGLIAVLLFRRVEGLGRLTVALWVGVLCAIAWILMDGAVHFRPAVAFDWPASPTPPERTFVAALGAAMLPALYSYLGYYNVCYVGDEVRDPGRVIPRSILLSAGLVTVLFVGVHLALLGVVSWRDLPTDEAGQATFSLASEFMRRLHGDWAATLMSALLVGSCFGSAFAALLGYSRVPYGAARYGHFFGVLGRVHPGLRVPHVSLGLVCGLTAFWTFFNLEAIIPAIIVTRILEQFAAQVGALLLLRAYRPELPRPFRMWLYPLPALAALAGWMYVYAASGWFFVALGSLTLLVGAVAFLLWAAATRTWPFAGR